MQETTSGDAPPEPGTGGQADHQQLKLHTHLKAKSQLHRHRAESGVAWTGAHRGLHHCQHTLWDVGELHSGGMQGVARRSKWAMTTTAVCRKSMESSLSSGRVRYLRKLSLGLSGPDRSYRKGNKHVQGHGRK